jgi:ATP-binding cassette subfamily C protein
MEATHRKKETFLNRMRRTASVLYELYGNYKRYGLILLTLGLLGGFLESFGISILVPLFSHILQQSSAQTDTISRFFNWFFAFIGIDTRLRFLLPLIAFVFVARAAVLYAFELIKIRIGVDYEKTTRTDLYRSLMTAPWQYLSRQKIGFAENTVMVDVTATTRLFADLTNTTLHFSSLAIYVIVAILINPVVAGVTLVTGILLGFVFRPFVVRTSRYGGKNTAINKIVAHDVNESIIGLKTIKALGVEHALVSHASALFDDLGDLKVKQVITKAATTLMIEPASVIFVLLVFVFAFVQKDFNFAVFMITIFLIQRIFIYFDRTQNLSHVIAENIPYAEHVVSVRRELHNLKIRESGTKPFQFTEALTFNAVSFTYGRRDPVLTDISFSIPRGSMSAIVGPSGSGKTTMVDLMLRLLLPSQGTVVLDGVSIDQISINAWHAKVGYVAQEAFLINGTVEENIRFFDPAVSSDDISYALQAAHLQSLIDTLPEGVKSMVGERGVEISGGERQRIALARVLARRPELLVLDEATSALDMVSERAIAKALEDLRGKVTMVIIAHKLETVRRADTVHFVKEGNLLESGNPGELLGNPQSHFARFFETA